MTGILATLGGVLDARPARVIAVDATGPALVTPLRLTPPPESAGASVGDLVIEGRVRTATGVAVAGALVALTAAEALPDAPPKLVAVARSDAAGRFRFAGLALAAHELGASAPGFAPGGATVAALALTGAPQRCEIVLGPPGASGASEVTGTVRDHRGQVRPGALIVAERPGQPALVGYADARGQYRLLLGRGPHTLVARAPGQLAARQHRQLTGAATIDFALAPAGRLRGRVMIVPSATTSAFVRVARTDGEPGAGDDEREVRTADGTFVLDDLAPGRYAVFARAGAHAGLAPRPVVVAPGDEVAVTMTLGRGHAVTGRLRDARGAPVPAAAVTLVPAASGRGLAMARTESRTGRDGRFVLTGVLPGRYRIEATGARHAPAASELAVTADRDGVTLTLPPATALTGTVRDAHGRPVVGAVVHAFGHPAEAMRAETRTAATRVPASRALARTGGDGRFTLTGLGAGRARLVAAHADLGVREFVVDGGRRDVTVRFASPIAISGRVRWHDDDPAGGARVRFVAQTLEGLGPGLEAYATTASDGRYRLYPVQPGTGRLFAERPRDAAARWLPVGPGRARQQRMLHLAGAPERSEADLVLLRDDLTVTGRVLGPEGAPVAGATVTAWLGSDGRGEPARAARADATGRFVLGDLPAGEYELRASHPLHPSGRRAGVIAGADGIDVRLPAGATLRGRFVVAADGDPGPVELQVVPALTAGATTAGAPILRSERWLFAGADAGFAVGPLAPGEYHVIAHALGGATAHLAGVTITEGGAPADVVLTLTDPPATLAHR